MASTVSAHAKYEFVLCSAKHLVSTNPIVNVMLRGAGFACHQPPLHSLTLELSSSKYLAAFGHYVRDAKQVVSLLASAQFLSQDLSKLI